MKITANGHEWYLENTLSEYTMWCSFWYTLNNDRCRLFISKTGNDFYLKCFGVGSVVSKIVVAKSDHEMFKEKLDIQKKGLSFQAEAVNIADHLCSILCNWQNFKHDNY